MWQVSSLHLCLTAFPQRSMIDSSTSVLTLRVQCCTHCRCMVTGTIVLV